MFNDYDDQISISFINLEKRKERLLGVRENLSEMHYDLKKINTFRAIENRFGEIGCASSHKILCTELLKNSKAKYHLIFEDDFRFAVPLVTIKKIISLFEEKEIDFDFFNLYGEWPVAIKRNKVFFQQKPYFLYRLFNSYTTGCYLIPKHFLQDMINHFEFCERKLRKQLKKLQEKGFEERFRSFTTKDETFRIFIANHYSIDQYWRNLMVDSVFIGLNYVFGYTEPYESDVESRPEFQKKLEFIKKISDLT